MFPPLWSQSFLVESKWTTFLPCIRTMWDQQILIWTGVHLHPDMATWSDGRLSIHQSILSRPPMLKLIWSSTTSNPISPKQQSGRERFEWFLSFCFDGGTWTFPGIRLEWLAASRWNERRKVNTAHSMRWFWKVIWSKVVHLVAPNCTRPWSDCQIGPPSLHPGADHHLQLQTLRGFQCSFLSIILSTFREINLPWSYIPGITLTEFEGVNAISNLAQPLTYPLLELSLTDSPQTYLYLMSYYKISLRWFQKSTMRWPDVLKDVEEPKCGAPVNMPYSI